MPVIDTGIAHRDADVGQIGARIAHAPHDFSAHAINALAASLAWAGAGRER